MNNYRPAIAAFCFGLVWAVLCPHLGIPMWSASYWAVVIPGSVLFAALARP